jgi:hypothetical protein
MGYYTRYNLTVPDGIAGAALRTRVAEAAGTRVLPSGALEERLTWYDHESDIAEAMRATGVPRVALHLEGEEPGDVSDKEFTLSDGRVTCATYQYTLVRPTEPNGTKEIS